VLLLFHSGTEQHNVAAFEPRRNGEYNVNVYFMRPDVIYRAH